MKNEETENQNKKNYSIKKNQDANRGVININNNKLLLNLPLSGKIGDMILNVDRIKTNFILSNEEKEVIYKENMLERKKKIMELKKRKNIIK